jgi:hypothetical protein
VNERQRPRAVLDSDIIFSRVLHELMVRIAAELRLREDLSGASSYWPRRRDRSSSASSTS